MDAVIFGMPLTLLIALTVILALSALMSGLSGFGFAAIGASCLWILPTIEAVPLLLALGLVNQCISLGQLRKDLPPFKAWWRDGPGPYLVGGFIGVPFGLAILKTLPTTVLMILVGFFLVAYAGYSLSRRAQHGLPRRSPWPVSVLIGLFGGIIGGFTAFPSAPVVIWTNINNIPKRAARWIVQPYILGLQIISLVSMAIAFPQLFSSRFFELFLTMLIFVLPGTLLGVRLYRSLSDVNFRRIAFILLGLSGSSLLVKAIGSVMLGTLTLALPLVHQAHG